MAAVSARSGLIEKLCVAVSAYLEILHVAHIHTPFYQRDEKVGIYGFIFCVDGDWRDVIIDDQLFIIAPRWESLDENQRAIYHGNRDRYDAVGRKGSAILYFAKGRSDNETWVPLMEKVHFPLLMIKSRSENLTAMQAYAKLHGDYDSLDGGCTNEGIEDLTGCVSYLPHDTGQSR